MQRTKWIDKKFILGLEPGWMPNVLERLRGTPVRLRDMVRNVSHEEAVLKSDGAWSIQEHIGHLADLEDLHEGRIDDFLARAEVLRAADMNNARTYKANHNEADLERLLENFKKKRSVFISRLENLDDDTLNFASLHPRLKISMRPVDMACFTAEHDDHHLASIRAILDPP